MYINPFWAGVFCVLLAEMALIITVTIVGIIKAKEKMDGKSKKD